MYVYIYNIYIYNPQGICLIYDFLIRRILRKILLSKFVKGQLNLQLRHKT